MLARWHVSDPEQLFEFMTREDLDDHRRANVRRRAYLARYGRQNMLELLTVPLTMVRTAFEAVAAIVREENELSSVQENM